MPHVRQPVPAKPSIIAQTPTTRGAAHLESEPRRCRRLASVTSVIPESRGEGPRQEPNGSSRFAVQLGNTSSIARR